MLPSPLWSLIVSVHLCLNVEGQLWLPLDRFWVLTAPLGLAFSGKRHPLHTLGEEDLGQCISEWVVHQCSNSISELPHSHWPAQWVRKHLKCLFLIFFYASYQQQVKENTTAGKWVGNFRVLMFKFIQIKGYLCKIQLVREENQYLLSST